MSEGSESESRATGIQVEEVVVPVEVPVKPLSRREMKQLEAALIIGTMFRPDVIQGIMSREEVTTWIDSLAVAAAALAMDKAGYPVSQIAEELGRTEATIRKHLKGETKAGKLVRETYEMLVRGELKISVPVVSKERHEEKVKQLTSEIEKLREENSKLKEEVEKLRQALKMVVEALSKVKSDMESALSAASKVLEGGTSQKA